MKASTDLDYFAHVTAVIDQPCEIGAGTKIWHFSHIMAHSRIGKNCSIGQNCFVASRVAIGNQVKIQNNVSIYEGVILEDEVFCGPSMVFTNVSTPRSGFARNRPEDYIETLVKKGASIGANATIVCGHVIGEYALVGAGAVITRDVPDHAVVFGNPARVRGYACDCGHVLSTDSQPVRCAVCGSAWQLNKKGISRVAAR